MSASPEGWPFPQKAARRYPVVGAIVDDVELTAAGACRMPAERFARWARLLAEEYPRNEHPLLYEMLAGMSLVFAERKTFAAVQLFALATQGLPAEDAQRQAAGNDYLRARESQEALRRLTQPLDPPGGAAPAPPARSGGATLRPRKPR